MMIKRKILITLTVCFMFNFGCERYGESLECTLHAVTSNGDSVTLCCDGTWRLIEQSEKPGNAASQDSFDSHENTQADRISAVVRNIIDGDTYEVELVDPPAGMNSTEIVRLLGVNAPEISKHQHFAVEASEYASDILVDKDIQLEFGERSRDAFCRLLAYVYIGENVMINTVLLEEGYAKLYTKSNHPLYMQFKEIQDSAMTRMVGLWAKKQGNIHIIYIHNHGREEHLVIMNASEGEVDLSGWLVEDKSGSSFRIPEGTGLPVNTVLKIYSGINGVNEPPYQLYFISENIWNNDGDEAFLLNKSGKIVDSYIY